jgi:hypothetical protein
MSGDGLHKMDFVVRRRHSLRRTEHGLIEVTLLDAMYEW